MIRYGERVIIGETEYDESLPEGEKWKGRLGTAGADQQKSVAFIHIDGVPDPPFLGEFGWAFKAHEVEAVNG